jgi:acetyltransferase-like isoleucine patch superfamily enzyme
MNSRLFWSAISLPLPWILRRRLLSAACGYKIAKTARIGFSLISIEKLVMEEKSSIGHLNMIKSFDLLHLGEHAKIGIFNWISGIDSKSSKHFGDEQGRRPELVIERHSSITARHFIDCCNRVTIGEFSTVAGAGTQILTHGIDIKDNRQRSAPVNIGRYCFVGTGAVLLKGSALPDYCVLAANSTLHRMHEQTHTIYSGVPATVAAKLPADALYFHRTTGPVK